MDIPGWEYKNVIYNRPCTYWCTADYVTDVINMRSSRGANIDSDHYLFRKNLRTRISNVKKEKDIKVPIYSIVVEVLKYDSLWHLEMLDQSLRIEEHWNKSKVALQNAAETVVKKKPEIKHKNWYDEECKQTTGFKNMVYLKLKQHRTRNAIEEYQETKRQNILKEIEEWLTFMTE